MSDLQEIEVLRFDLHRTCPKCMGYEVKMTRADGPIGWLNGKWSYKDVGERIKVTCRRCFYEWLMKTADAE